MLGAIIVATTSLTDKKGYVTEAATLRRSCKLLAIRWQCIL